MFIEQASGHGSENSLGGPKYSDHRSAGCFIRLSVLYYR